ncbi:MAG: tetraacyldisaccharide 4'-kinase [Pseudomonadota bacterium]
MRPPRFWTNPPARPGFWSQILLPLSYLWAKGTARRLANGHRVRPGVPVIAIGNINLGGTGKTPTAVAIADILQQAGHAPHIVSRGYGGRIEGPHRVRPMKDKAEDVGDEPLFLSAFAPVWVSRDRISGAQQAVTEGADCIILDDALQNPNLYHDLTVTVVDAEVGFGNGRVCPSGPLREPVSTALARTDLLISIEVADKWRLLSKQWPELCQKPVAIGVLNVLETGHQWDGLPTYAFAGIGRPQKFFNSLKAAGARLLETRAFGDHQTYTLTILKRMQAEAWAKGAHLVTTEKDAVRLPPEFRLEVMTFPVRLEFDDETVLRKALLALFAQRA